MTTDVKICSVALLDLGGNAISSFSDDSDAARFCASVYPLLKENILSMYDWRFTVTKARLNRETSTPENRWTYQYALPSDAKTDGLLALYDSGEVGARPVQNFQLFGKKVLCDYEDVYIDYQGDISNEATWPGYFVELMTKAMSARACMFVTDNATLKVGLEQTVYGTPQERGVGGLMGMCRARNAKDQPGDTIENFDLLAARFGSGGT